MKTIKCVAFAVVFTLPLAVHSQTLNEQINTILFSFDSTNCDMFPMGENLRSICLVSLNGGGVATGANSSASSGNVSYTEVINLKDNRKNETEDFDSLDSEYQQILSSFLLSNVAEHKFTKNFGLFISAYDGDLNKNETSVAEAYKDNFDGQTLGLDFSLSPNVNIGVFGHRQNSNISFSTGSRTDRDSDGFGGFFTINSDSGLFVAGYHFEGSDDYQLNRSIEVQHPADLDDNPESKNPQPDFPIISNAMATTSGEVKNSRISTGISRNFTHGGISLSVGYNDYERTVDAYEEQGNTGVELNFPGQKIESKLTELTLGGHYRKPLDNMLLVPFAELSYLHESETKPDNVVVSLVEDLRENPALFTIQQDELDDDFYKGRIGLSMFFNNGFSITAGYENLFGNDLFDGDMVFLQVRFSR